MALLKPKFDTANQYDKVRELQWCGATYGYLHNQDEDDFKVVDSRTGELAIDLRTGKALSPQLDVEYPLVRAGFNGYYGYKYYANVMFTKGIDDFLREECGIRRDSYDVSILLRLKDHDEAVVNLAGHTMQGEAMERAPLPEGHSAEVITPLFR